MLGSKKSSKKIVTCRAHAIKSKFLRKMAKDKNQKKSKIKVIFILHLIPSRCYQRIYRSTQENNVNQLIKVGSLGPMSWDKVQSVTGVSQSHEL